MSADADRIAQLTAELERTKVELAEARRDLHEERGRSRDYLAALEHDLAAHEQTKAELARVQANAKANDDLWRHKYNTAQAEAAAMREALDELLISSRGLRPKYDSDSDRDFQVRWRKASDAAQKALALDAGRELAERVRKLEEVAKAAYRYYHGLSGEISSHEQIQIALADLAALATKGASDV